MSNNKGKKNNNNKPKNNYIETTVENENGVTTAIYPEEGETVVMTNSVNNEAFVTGTTVEPYETPSTTGTPDPNVVEQSRTVPMEFDNKTIITEPAPIKEKQEYKIENPLQYNAGKFEVSAGGMLTAQKIKEAINNGDIQITPFNPENINPNSYNLTLSPILKVYDDKVLDAHKKNKTNRIIIPASGLILQPGELYIGATNEITLTDKYIPVISGRSTIGRLGISVHVTAGFGDVGFRGTWTLEITAVKKVRIYPNDEICQIYWFTPAGDTNVKYDGRYQGQIEPIEARGEYTKKIYDV